MVAFDQRAVQDDVGHCLVLAAVQHHVQVRGLLSQDADPFVEVVEVAVDSGLGDAHLAGQAVHAHLFAEPAQDKHILTERAERMAATRGADAARPWLRPAI